MVHVFIPALQVLSGLCIYAAIIHLITAVLVREPRRLHVLFAITAIAAGAYALSEAAIYRASDAAQLVPLLRINLAFVMATFLGFVWSITAYTGVGSRAVLFGITALVVFLFSINLIEPYTLQFATAPRLYHLHLPWAETLSIPHGRTGRWFGLAVVTHFAVLAYLWGALLVAYRRHRHGGALALLVAVLVLTLVSAEGVMVRTGHLAFIHLGGIGILIMVLAMTVVLFYDTTEEIHASEHRFRSLVEQSPFSIHVLAPDGRSRQVNAAWQKLWDKQPPDKPDYNIFNDPDTDREDVLLELQAVFSGRSSVMGPIQYRIGDLNDLSSASGERWIRTYGYPLKDAYGSVRDVILMHEDVTESKRVEDAIRLIAAGVSSVTGEQFFQQLTRSLSQVFGTDYAVVAAVDTDDPNVLDTLAVWANGKPAPNLRYSVSDNPCAQVLGSQGCVYASGARRKFPHSRMLSEMTAEAYVGVPLRDAEGRPLGLLAVVHSRPVDSLKPIEDILQIFAARASAELTRRRAEQRLRDMAYRDELTGLASRARLLEILESAQAQARQRKTYGALISIDLDHFKTINDALGHDIGDEVLRSVAHRLQEVGGTQAQMARLGGDEFAAVLDTGVADQEQARRAVERIANRMIKQLASPIFVGDRTFVVGASVGIVLFSDDADTPHALLRQAEMALYRAKQLGRDNIQFYMASMQEVANDRLRLEAGLRQVLARNELSLHMQPQINHLGQLVGAEALLRWEHPELGNVPPSEFISVAEETGLIHSIGHWVYERACQYINTWKASGLEFGPHLSVNVSPWQFVRPDFVQQIVDSVRTYQVDPCHLMLELTETGLLMDLEDAIRKLQELRAHGFRIALDDFGTGYSSLAYLKDLPLDEIKIDKSFVSQLKPYADNPLVRSMVSIGQHMRLSVVAEGVETVTQRDILAKMGCQVFQGYLFHRPMTATAFQQLCSSTRTSVSRG